MIPFSKYHGCGNDFIIVTEEAAAGREYSELAEQICHRQLGVGADGLIVVGKDPLEMIFYNSDGSRAPMCGNGIRCFAKYCSDEGICSEEEYPVKTLAGTMLIKIVGRDPFLAEVAMGKPNFDPKRCGISDRAGTISRRLPLKSGPIEVSSCFMGTIHTVVWMDNLNSFDLAKLGEEISNHPVFSEKTNVNFVRIITRKTLELITYERGVGMTLACGTGACASVVIGVLEGRCDRDVWVLLPCGRLRIEQKADNEVMMTGPAVRTVKGCYDESRKERHL